MVQPPSPQAYPGDDVTVSVLVTNTGSTTIGAQTVVITAPVDTQLVDGVLSVSSVGYPGSLSADRRTATCLNVPVNLGPGQQAVFSVSVRIGVNAAPGPVSVAFTLGAPAFAAGNGSIEVF
ncbi:hypothetical protein [Streptomyces sp. NPDC002537]